MHGGSYSTIWQRVQALCSCYEATHRRDFGKEEYTSCVCRDGNNEKHARFVPPSVKGRTFDSQYNMTEMAQSMKGLECTVESIKNLMASMSNLDGKWRRWFGSSTASDTCNWVQCSRYVLLRLL